MTVLYVPIILTAEHDHSFKNLIVSFLSNKARNLAQDREDLARAGGGVQHGLVPQRRRSRGTLVQH